MAADATVDIVVNQKASFQVTFYVRNAANSAALDLSGYTHIAKYKTDFNSPDSTAGSFTTLTTNAANGEITMSLTPEQTANLQLTKYVYDLSIIQTSGGFKTRIVEGIMRVSGGVA
jgi:hypothetical protein